MVNKNRAARWPWMKSATILLLLTSSVRAQSALDGFDPNANGPIRDVVVQSDGKILLSGSFTTLSPNGGAAVTRNNIARLNADGTLDTAFNPNANGVLYALTVQPDGNILVGGVFTNIGGQSRSHIARLDATTGLADSFDPNANYEIYSIVQSNGKILVGGLFTTIGGVTRNHIARLDATTGLVDSFDPNASNSVTSIVVQSDGKIVTGGAFSGPNGIGGATRNHIARLDPATGLADSFDPNANSVVFALALQADGKILAGGEFNGVKSIGGATRNHIARLDPTTGLADSFDPNANGGIASIAVQGDGKILVGGLFNDHIGGATRNYIARLDPTTGLADSFDPHANNLGSVYAVAVQSDGKVLVGGAFTSLAPNGGATTTRNHIARLEADGRLDQTLNTNIVGNQFDTVLATAVQADGKILMGGRFRSVLGVPRNSIARLNTDGTLDMAFDPNAGYVDPFHDVAVIVVQADGKILVGGYFNGINSIGGQNRNFIARLDPVTGLADSFDPNANNPVFAITVDADGKILVGGRFNGANSIGGQLRNRIARLDPSTGMADSFDPNANDAVFTIATQSDGKVLAGGQFTNVGGQARNRIARLDHVTGLADSFDPNPVSSEIDSIAIQADGKILVGGIFISIGGQTRWRIARLDPTTGLADSFDPHATTTNSSGIIYSILVDTQGKILVGGFFDGIGGQPRNGIARLDPLTGLADSFNPNANNGVFSTTVQADGKILAGGLFTNIGGQPRSLFARLSSDTAAFQDLAVTQAAIVWTRDGSSQLCTRVTFEFSNDNLNYTPLGNGTAAGSNWTLTGLDLPTGQNFYVRARGHYSGGSQNGSGSITESVRNVFLPMTAPTPAPTSTPVVTPTPTSPPINISGNISYCSNPISGPVPNVTLSLTGDTGGSTLSDGSGNYTFASLPSGGSYVVMPTKTDLSPGATAINTIDVVATQRHFLIIGTPLTGCRLTAADVNADSSVNTIDVVAIQRFFLALSTGTANVGRYEFTPVSRSYQAIVTDQTEQNYDTIVFGDVAPGFVH